MPLLSPRLFGGVRLVDRPALDNVRRLDAAPMPCLQRMMQTGMRIDKPYFAALDKQLANEQRDIEDSIDKCLGHPVNPASGRDVANLLFRELGITKVKDHKLVDSKEYEKTGKLDLEPYWLLHPVVPLLFEWRERKKLRTTYVQPLPALARLDREGHWRVHTEILTTRTTTGRFASKNPNLQNIPTRTALGTAIRNGFIAPPGRVLISSDLSQIEVRAVAHLANVARMIDTFNRGGDIHIETASSVFHLPPEQLHPKKHRYPCKRVTFGVVYLIGPPGLARQLNSADAQDSANPYLWTEDACALLIKDWFGVYPEIPPWHRRQFNRARRFSCVWDLFGRIRLIPEMKSALPYLVSAGERQAGNMPVQATAGGILKLGMGRMHEAFNVLRAAGEDVRELMTVHDECIAEANPQRAKEIGAVMQESMQDAVPLVVPVRSSCDVAERWGDLK